MSVAESKKILKIDPATDEDCSMHGLSSRKVWPLNLVLVRTEVAALMRTAVGFCWNLL